MIVRNKIWEEIKQAYANVLCLRWYTDKQRKYERWYQMFVAIVASGGTFGYLINSYFPLVSTATIASWQSLNHYFHKFFNQRENYVFLMI